MKVILLTGLNSWDSTALYHTLNEINVYLYAEGITT